MTGQQQERPPLWSSAALACFALVGLTVGLRAWWLGASVPASLASGVLTYCALVLAPVLALLAAAAGLLIVALFAFLVRR
jgi:apolipoprotein N-acyltransferase